MHPCIQVQGASLPRLCRARGLSFVCVRVGRVCHGTKPQQKRSQPCTCCTIGSHFSFFRAAVDVCLSAMVPRCNFAWPSASPAVPPVRSCKSRSGSVPKLRHWMNAGTYFAHCCGLLRFTCSAKQKALKAHVSNACQSLRRSTRCARLGSCCKASFTIVRSLRQQVRLSRSQARRLTWQRAPWIAMLVGTSGPTGDRCTGSWMLLSLRRRPAQIKGRKQRSPS